MHWQLSHRSSLQKSSMKRIKMIKLKSFLFMAQKTSSVLETICQFSWAENLAMTLKKQLNVESPRAFTISYRASPLPKNRQFSWFVEWQSAYLARWRRMQTSFTLLHLLNSRRHSWQVFSRLKDRAQGHSLSSSESDWPMRFWWRTKLSRLIWQSRLDLSTIYCLRH